MPQCQMNALLAQAHYLPKIAEQLEIANKLKALELKARAGHDFKLSAEMVDEAMRVKKKDVEKAS